MTVDGVFIDQCPGWISFDNVLAKTEGGKIRILVNALVHKQAGGNRIHCGSVQRIVRIGVEQSLQPVHESIAIGVFRIPIVVLTVRHGKRVGIAVVIFTVSVFIPAVRADALDQVIRGFLIDQPEQPSAILRKIRFRIGNWIAV